jgi:hypothetical protein
MPGEFGCEGAPRDLGFDQGRACREELAARFARTPVWERWGHQLGWSESHSVRVARDLRRHFPQQSEALEGMERGADVPRGWLASVLARELGTERPTRIGAAFAFAANATRTAGNTGLVRTLDCDPVVRHSRPEGGFASVELTLPWLTAALAGVNEGGLAATWVGLPGEFAAVGSSAPAALLIQDCLMRFDSIPGAVDWCTGRPCGGRAVILLADSSGEVAAVEIDGRERRVRTPDAGLVFAGEDDVSAEALRVHPKPDLEAGAELLGRTVAGVDPLGRRLALRDAASGSRWFEVEAPE